MRLSARFALSIVAALLALPAAGGDDKPAKQTVEQDSAVEVVELTVDPAPAPRAALRYHLLPQYLDKTPGNAALLYGEAGLMLADVKTSHDTWGQVVKWIEAPPDQLPREEVRKTLAQFNGVLGQVELAARRTQCDWALPIREMANPFELPLPAFQRLRDLARLVALKARLKIAEGRLDEAIQDLRVGFAMARHAGEGGIIVSDLVGVAIADIMLGQLETLIQSPRAMNLYWAVTALPAPLVDLRDALEVEAVTLYLLFPEFKDVTTRKYSPKQWEAVYDEAEVISKLEAFVELIHGDGSESKEVKEVYRKTLEEGLPAVKRELVERGYSEEELERMPASQVVVLHVSETFEESRDEMFKWFHVPYWQGRQGVEAAQMHMLEGASKQKGGAALAYVMFPALGVCPVTVTRLERRIAALRVLEAVRLYAAAHDGKLPASLDDLVEVPIPDNPFTGKPFGYRLEGDTAVLEAGGPERSRPRQYRVTLAK